MEKPVIGVGTLNLSERAKELVLDVLNNNRLSYGPYSQKFENSFAKIHGCRFGILSNSGTSALHVALGALKEIYGWKDGDEVIVPSLTFVATYNIVLHNNMTPILVDIEPDYYSMDPKLLESKITKRTRAIIPVHLFGQPSDMQPIKQIADRYELKIIEDSCETMFAKYNNSSVGSLSDIGCFSTYVAHLLVTGVGGLCTTNNPDYAIHIRSLVNHGRDSIYISIDDDNNLSPEELRMIIARRFSFISIGHSFRVTEMESALAVAQLENWQDMISKRRSNAKFLSRGLSKFSDKMQLPAIRPGSEHSFMMYPIVLRNEPKVELVNYLEQHGIETRDMLPLTNQPVYKKLFKLDEDQYPIAKWINNNGFYIGCHQDIKSEDLNYIVEIFEKFRMTQRKEKPPKESNTLILLVNDRWNVSESFLEDIPTDLFDELTILNLGPPVQKWENLALKLKASLQQYKEKNVFTGIYSGKLRINGDNILIFTADGHSDIKDIGRLVLQIDRGYDMVIASRFIAGGARNASSSSNLIRSAGNRIFTLFANLIFIGNLTDSLNSLRIIKKNMLLHVLPTSSFLTNLYRISIHSLKYHWKINEISTVEKNITRAKRLKSEWLSIIPLFMTLIKDWLSGTQKNK